MSLNNWKDLKIIRKTTKIYELIFTKDGIAQDITGWTVYFTVKENMQDSDENAKIKKAITSHTDAVNGKTTINLTTEDTDLEAKSYYYSIDVKDNEGNQVVLFYGHILFEEPVLKNRV